MAIMTSRAVTPFTAPETSLAGLRVDAAAMVIASAADIALIVDAQGVVLDVAFGSEDLAKAGFKDWIGRSWPDTVVADGAPKIAALLQDAASGQGRWRQVNHPVAHPIEHPGAANGDARVSDGGMDAIPIIYAATRIDEDGRIVAVGRDLRAMASLQQRLVEAQRSMERDYARLREAETRYRLLFQLASEAVLIVEDASAKIIEANPSAMEIIGAAVKKPVGRSFFDLFAADRRSDIQSMLAAVRLAGRSDPITASLREVGDKTGELGAELMVSASLFRHEAGALFLVRLWPTERTSQGARVSRRTSNFLKVVESAPEALVVTDLDGVILTSNSAFLEVAQLAAEEQARGQPIERWLGRPGVDVGVILGSLREHGSMRLFSTMVRGELGAVADVELSAVSVPHGDPPCIGFMIRNVEPRPAPRTVSADAPALPKSVEQLTELVGRVPLKDIVRETTDVIERLCIEAALDLTGDNRASAAEMLGLSRQSLYVKLRRYGLGDLDADSDAS